MQTFKKIIYKPKTPSLSAPQNYISLQNPAIKPPPFHDFQIKTHLKTPDSLTTYLQAHDLSLRDYLDFYKNGLIPSYFSPLPSFDFTSFIPRISLMCESPNGKILALGYRSTISLFQSEKEDIFSKTQSNFQITLQNTSKILAICFDEDNETLFTAGTETFITSWDLRDLTNNNVSKLKTYHGHKNFVSSLAFSQQTLASGSFDGTIRLWEHEKESRVLAKHKDKVISLSFSKNARYLASGSMDCSIIIWNLQENIEEKVLAAHQQEITSVSFSPFELEKLVSAGLDMSVRLWDLVSKRNKVLYQGSAGIENVDNARFSQDGMWIVAVIENKELILWSTEREIQEHRLTIKQGFITDVAFSRNRQELLFCDTLKIQRIQLKSLNNLNIRHFRLAPGSIQDFFVKDEKMAVWDYNRVYIYEKQRNPKAFRLKNTFPLHSNEAGSFTLKACVAENGEYLAISSDYSIDVFEIKGDLEDFSQIKRVNLEHSLQKQLKILRFSPKARFLAAGFPNKLIVYSQEDLHFGAQLVNICGISLKFPADGQILKTLAFSHDEEKLAASISPNILVFWKVSSPENPCIFLKNKHIVTRIEFSQSDSKLFTGTAEGLVIVWEINTQIEEKVLLAHNSKIQALKLLPCGLQLVTCAKDKVIKMWDLATSQHMKTFGPFNETVKGVKMSRNGHKILFTDEKELVSVKLRGFLAVTQVKIVADVLKEQEDKSCEEIIKSYPKLFSLESARDLLLFNEVPPYNLSIFHYLAYQQHEKALENLLLFAKFYRITPKFSLDFAIPLLDKPSHTPLSLAMEMNNIAIMHLFIKALKENSLGPGCCPSITTKILSTLIEYDPSYVSELLESRFCEPYGEIPRTYYEFDEPLQASLNLIVVKENDLEANLLNKRTEAIKKTFKKTLLKNEPIHKKCRNCCKRRWDLNKAVRAQSQGVELIKSLEIRMLDLPGIIDAENDENFFIKTHELDSDHCLFGSRAFLAILQYKWDSYARDFFLSEALFYLVYLMTLLVYSLYFFPQRAQVQWTDAWDFANWQSICLFCLDVVLCVFLLVFLMKELFSIHKLRWRYFLDLDNYMDIPALLFLALLLFHEIGSREFSFSDPNTKELRVYHSITLFLASLRFLSFARGFEAMAFMIRLIIQVTIDMSYFLIIMFFITCSLAFAGYLLQQGQGLSVFESFNAFYRLILGDFEGFDALSEHSVAFSLIWTAFLIGTLIIMIVMLNLLISIISDTYGKVSSMNKLANAYEKTGIIIEIDKKLSAKKKLALRNKGFFQKFLYVAYCQELKEKDEDEQQNRGLFFENKAFFDEKRDYREHLTALQNIEGEIFKINSLKEKLEEFSNKSLHNQEIIQKRLGKILEIMESEKKTHSNLAETRGKR